jgi:hypothetical protein
VLHGLEFGDGSFEGDPLVGIAHGHGEDGFECTRGFDGANRAAHQEERGLIDVA